MNRSLALVGLVLVIVGILLVSIPFLVTSGFQVGYEFYGAGVLFLVGLVILFQAAIASDPHVTTVGGLLGNPIVDESRKAEEAVTNLPATRVRYAPGPKEPVNCRYCYTAIPWNVLDCPRCARPRHCRNCGKQLYYSPVPSDAHRVCGMRRSAIVHESSPRAPVPRESGD